MASNTRAGGVPPPYVAVIFTSMRREGNEAEYRQAASAMEALARRQPGFLGLESVRDPGGEGVTVSYWEDEKAALAWKEVDEHLTVQELGRTRFYEWYRVRVAVVTRSYGSTS